MLQVLNCSGQNPRGNGQTEAGRTKAEPSPFETGSPPDDKTAATPIFTLTRQIDARKDANQI